MKNSDKVAVYAACIADSKSLSFGQRNLLLADVARAMGCKHFFDQESIGADIVFSLHSTNKHGFAIQKPLYRFRMAAAAWNTI